MQIYLVGGAVRDQVMGKDPVDRDWLITGALPEDVQRLLADGYQQVGADFPVFLHPTTGEEYALARIERKTGRGYHQFEVMSDATVTLEEDLARRDLTMNSMALNDLGQIIDPFGGQGDIKDKILRHTSPAFAEDPLRVLRLARFAARYPDFTIDEETLKLCNLLTKSGELNHLSNERIWTELEKGFKTSAPWRFMQVLHDTGALVHSKILNDVFGGAHTKYQERCAEQLTEVPLDQRLYIAVGLLGQSTTVLPGAPTRAVDCLANICMFDEAERWPSQLHSLLKSARAMSAGDAFPDFLTAVHVRESAGISASFTLFEIEQAAIAMRSVKASLFPSLEGKILGEAIKARQIQEIAHVLGVQHSVRPD